MNHLFDNWRMSFLFEARIDDLIEKYPNDEKVIRYFSENDPAGNDKYLRWMHKQFLNGVASPQIITKVTTEFHKNRQRLDQKDIYQWDFDNLKNKLDSLGKTNKQRKEEGAIKLFEDDEWLFVIPTTKKTACTYGSNTKWCITMNDEVHWEEYVSGGIVFLFIINKMRDPGHSNSKWALVFKPQDDQGEFRGANFHPFVQIFDAEDNKIAGSYVAASEILEPRIGEERFDMIMDKLEDKYSDLVRTINIPTEKQISKLLGIAEKLGLDSKIKFTDGRNGDRTEVTSPSDLQYANYGDIDILFNISNSELFQDIYYRDVLAQLFKNHKDLAYSITFDEIEKSPVVGKHLFGKPIDIRERAVDMLANIGYDSEYEGVELKTIGDVIRIAVRTSDHRRENVEASFQKSFIDAMMPPADLRLAEIAHKFDFRWEDSIMHRDGQRKLNYLEHQNIPKEIVKNCTDNLLKYAAHARQLKKKYERDPLWSKIYKVYEPSAWAKNTRGIK